MKRMMHPQHGFHNALDGNEEAAMRLNGWVDDAPAEVAIDLAEKQDDAPAEVVAVPAKRAYNRKAK